MKFDMIYKDHSIEPKRDFGTESKQTGFVVVKDFCNAMPAACWFKTVDEAKDGVDVLLRVKGNADRFWEIMQPFEYKRLGQKAAFENGHCNQGRFTALIKNFRVVELRTKSRDGKTETIRMQTPTGRHNESE